MAALEHFQPPNAGSQSAWLAGVAAEAYTPRPTTSSVADFVRKDWKEIAGVGIVVLAAGAVLVASHGGKLGALSDLLRGGESTTVTQRAGITGVSQDVLARLKDVKHFVFDMDRTLIDHDKSLSVLTDTMTDELVRHTGLSRQFISGALAQTTERLDSPFFWNRLDEIKPLQEQFPGVDLNERFAEVSRVSKAAYYDALKAKPETLEMLQFLRSNGKSVHVFTAGNPARALEKLQGAGVLEHLDNIYTSGLNAFEDAPTSGMLQKETATANIIPLPATAKSDGSGYPTILEHLSAAANRVAMTGDHPIEDVANAKALGLFASKANWYRSVPAESILPDLELSSPSQLTQAFKSAHAIHA